MTRIGILKIMKLQYKNTKTINNNQSGFAIVEAIFTVIIIAVVIGGGIYLAQRRNADSKTDDTNSSLTQ
jgi:type II secretory pathway pseudopilin PulG